MKIRKLAIIIIAFVAITACFSLPCIAGYSIGNPTDNGENGISYIVYDDSGFQVGVILELNGEFRSFLNAKGQIGEVYYYLQDAFDKLEAENN